MLTVSNSMQILSLSFPDVIVLTFCWHFNIVIFYPKFQCLLYFGVYITPSMD